MADAWDHWLSQHDVSTPEIIERAIKDAFGDWLLRWVTVDVVEDALHAAFANFLDDYSPAIIAAIAEASKGGNR